MDYITKHDAVYQILKNLILEGVLKPGERIVVSQITKKLNVSPMSVREALIRLRQDELVEIIPHVGSTVKALDLRILTNY